MILERPWPDRGYGQAGLEQDLTQPHPALTQTYAGHAAQVEMDLADHVGGMIDKVRTATGRTPDPAQADSALTRWVVTQALVNEIVTKAFGRWTVVTRVMNAMTRRRPVVELELLDPAEAAKVWDMTPWERERQRRHSPPAPAHGTNRVTVVTIWMRNPLRVRMDGRFPHLLLGRYTRLAIVTGTGVPGDILARGLVAISHTSTGDTIAVPQSAIAQDMLDDIVAAADNAVANYLLNPLRPLTTYVVEQGLSSALANGLARTFLAFLLGAFGQPTPIDAAILNLPAILGGSAGAAISGTADRWYHDIEWRHPNANTNNFDPTGRELASLSRLNAFTEDGDRLLDTLRTSLEDAFQSLIDDPATSTSGKLLAQRALNDVRGRTIYEAMIPIIDLLDNRDATHPSDPSTALHKRLGIKNVWWQGHNRVAIRFGTDRFGTTRGPMQLWRKLFGFQRRLVQALIRIDSKHSLLLDDPVSVTRVNDSYLIHVNPWAESSKMIDTFATALVRIRAELTAVNSHVPNLPTYFINRILTAIPGLIAFLTFTLVADLMSAAAFLAYFGAVLVAATANAVAAAQGESMVQWDRELTRWNDAQADPNTHPDGIHDFLAEVTDQVKRAAWLEGLIMRLNVLRTAEGHQPGVGPPDQRAPARLTSHGLESIQPDIQRNAALIQMLDNSVAFRLSGVRLDDPHGLLRRPPAAGPSP